MGYRMLSMLILSTRTNISESEFAQLNKASGDVYVRLFIGAVKGTYSQYGSTNYINSIGLPLCNQLVLSLDQGCFDYRHTVRRLESMGLQGICYLQVELYRHVTWLRPTLNKSFQDKTRQHCLHPGAPNYIQLASQEGCRYCASTYVCMRPVWIFFWICVANNKGMQSKDRHLKPTKVMHSWACACCSFACMHN